MTAGAAVMVGAFGMTPLVAAPVAHADPFDVVVDSILNSVEGLDGTVSTAGTDQLFEPDAVSAALTGAADSAPAPSLAADITNFDQMLANAFQQYIYLPIHTAGEDAAAAIGGSSALIDTGSDGGAGAAAATAATPATVPANVTVPLDITAVTEPLVHISVSGGASIPVVVDTGSNGLVMPWWDIGLDHLSLPTDFGFGAYSGGLNYFYLTFPETVTFQDLSGNDIVTTGTTDVNAFIFGFPTSLSGIVDFPWTLEQFLGSAEASGVLGIGPDAAGPDDPGTAAVLSALPGDLSRGVLFDEPNRELVFGPSQLTGGTTVQGVANSILHPAINGAPFQSVRAIIDSGGVFGTMPSSMVGAGAVGSFIPDGTEISVYNGDGELLYSYTTGGTAVGSNGPVVISANLMNTGYAPFAQMPVYINLDGSPSTTFYNGS